MALFDALLLDPAPFEVWIARRTSGPKGSGTLNDPWDGSTTARFDAVMSSLPANTPTTVHLGPGEFTTKGYTDDPGTTSGWEMKPGMRIVGSGMGVTTLKLDTITPTSAAQHFAVGHRLVTTVPVAFNPVDFCEVTDLTINCNLAGHATNVAAGAVRLMGNHVRVCRVKAINWGTPTTLKSCFVFQLITALTDQLAGRIELQNAVIDSCVAVEPDTSQGWGTDKISTVFHVGGLEEKVLQAEAYGLFPVIRNCFVDGMTADPEFCPPLEANTRALSMGWCRGGIVEGNQVHNVQIGGPYQDKATTREIVVRGNNYKNVKRGPWWRLGSLGSSISFTGIALVGTLPSSLAEATTGTAHDLVKGERVRISGAGPAAMNGVFVVAEVPATNRFQFLMETSLSVGSTTGGLQKVYGASNILVEQNVFELATTGALPAIQLEDGGVGTLLGLDQGPDYTCTEAIVRGNQVRYLDGTPGSSGGFGVDMAGVKDLIVRDQYLELVGSDALTPKDLLKDVRCRNSTYYNNRTPVGDLVRGYNGIGNYKYGELETDAEDVAVWSLVTSR